MKEVADILLGSRPNLRQLCNRAFQLGSEGMDRTGSLDRTGPDWTGLERGAWIGSGRNFVGNSTKIVKSILTRTPR